jgi:XTP/dITP diphosphohydrolase
VEGHILEQPYGAGGFGYDPLFAPEGHDRSFAELGPEVKNALSHRGRALAQVAGWLEKSS